MPFELTTPDAILFARVYGVFTAPELNHMAWEAEIAEASQPVSLDRITDLTAVERFEVGLREVYYFAVRRSRQRFSRVVKSAIVVQEPEQHGIARVYEAVNENPQIQIRIVRSLSEATEWFTERDVRPPEGSPNE
ncbi:MAG TPA: hypothetical protein VM533_03210 [Fimbriiglobus sp.]|jgi:hypothetical protein|nr:hypothetical protein [Fimbriiglobus sp.]